MAGIFISYRRADSDGWAGRLRDALRARFGDLVFQDVDNIPDGEIFSDVIDRALRECDVALVVIGPAWASARDEQGRPRLDNEDDWVRIETREVLNHKDKIRVIPVLVGGAVLPKVADLPEDLRPLTKRQAREIRSNTWDSDVALLSNHLQQIVGPRKRPVWVYAAPAAVVALGVGVFAGSRLLSPTAPSPSPRPTQAVATETVKETPTAVAPPVKNAAESAPVTPPRPAPVTPAPPARVAASPHTAKPTDSRTATAARASAPEPAPPRPAIAAAPPAKPSVAAAPVKPPSARPTTPAQEARSPAVVPAEPEAPTERVAAAPKAASKAASGTAPRSAVVNLPNRPASSRELRVGDSWTYRLREVHLNKNLALVTHEIGGGDGGGIRETLRVTEPTSTVTERRLALEPRIFEQQLDQTAKIFEFAPFMTAFSDLQPGVKWSRIAGAMNADASMSDWRFTGRVAGRESVVVPAGSFEAVRAELEGSRESSFPSTRNDFADVTAAYQTYSVWFVPEIGRAIKYERKTFNRVRRLLEHEQYELLSYQPK
jgi:hypothetical protein